MSLSGARPDRKPGRLGLYLPFAVLAALVVAWTLGWLWLRQATQQGLVETAAQMRSQGWRASWSGLHIGGYPFRLDVEADDLDLADPSGWSVAFPRLRAEAYAFAPTRWLAATDAGLTFTRPGAPPVRITAPLMRASLNSWDQHPPRISLVCDDLAFSGQPGAFPLAGAKSLQFYTRAGPDDQGALLLELDGGAAAPGSSLDRLAAGKPVALTLDAIFSHARALAGPDWRSAASAWARAGGHLTLQHLTFGAGATSLEAHAGVLTLDHGGGLSGHATASLSAGGGAATADLAFDNGQAALGPHPLGPSPRVY